MIYEVMGGRVGGRGVGVRSSVRFDRNWKTPKNSQCGFPVWGVHTTFAGR